MRCAAVSWACLYTGLHTLHLRETWMQTHLTCCDSKTPKAGGNVKRSRFAEVLPWNLCTEQFESQLPGTHFKHVPQSIKANPARGTTPINRDDAPLHHASAVSEATEMPRERMSRQIAP